VYIQQDCLYSNLSYLLILSNDLGATEMLTLLVKTLALAVVLDLVIGAIVKLRNTHVQHTPLLMKPLLLKSIAIKQRRIRR